MSVQGFFRAGGSRSCGSGGYVMEMHGMKGCQSYQPASICTHIWPPAVHPTGIALLPAHPATYLPLTRNPPPPAHLPPSLPLTGKPPPLAHLTPPPPYRPPTTCRSFPLPPTPAFPLAGKPPPGSGSNRLLSALSGKKDKKVPELDQVWLASVPRVSCQSMFLGCKRVKRVGEAVR